MAIKTGTSKRNAINGTAVDDLLFGRGASDTIRAGGGDDQLFGDSGNDHLFGDNGFDRLYGGSGKDFLFGGESFDYLNGGSGNDTLDGGNGGDTVIGGSGNDKIFMGSGPDADFVDGGEGTDTVDYSNSPIAVTAFLDSFTADGGALNDTWIAAENVRGTVFNDRLQGGDGGTCFGAGGNDTLFGSTGSEFERLRGDGGIDTLDMTFGATKAWLQFAQGPDIILGFVEGNDKLFIDLSNFGFGKKFDADELVNSPAGTARGGGSQLIYNNFTREIIFDENGSAAGGQTVLATFNFATTFSGGTLDLNDFDVIR